MDSTTSEEIKRIVLAIAENEDELAFKKLFKLFFPGLFAYANSMLYNKQLAEEAVNDVFIKIWNNRKMLLANTIHNFSFYLYTATKYTSINYLKKNKKFPSVCLSEVDKHFIISIEDPQKTVIHKENLQKIEVAINSLPLKCRLVFKLVKEDGMKYKEVASLLELSIKTVEAHMTLAYSRIVENLEEVLPEYSTSLKSKNTK